MFQALKHLYEQNSPIDQLTVVEHLEKTGQLENVGGEMTIAGLMRETASAANFEHHCEIIREKALLRK